MSNKNIIKSKEYVKYKYYNVKSACQIEILKCQMSMQNMNISNPKQVKRKYNKLQSHAAKGCDKIFEFILFYFLY